MFNFSRSKNFGGGEHNSSWVTTYPFSGLLKYFPTAGDITGHPSSKGPTTIKNDVWIGVEATILSGVTVGNGAIIGAKSLVTHDVPPYTIVAGNPARVIKQRFSDEQIKQLEEIAWWDKDINKIIKFIHLLCSNDIDNFITHWNN